MQEYVLLIFRKRGTERETKRGTERQTDIERHRCEKERPLAGSLTRD